MRDPTGTAEQGAVTRRYQRMAPLYDLYEAPMEALGTRARRERLLRRATGQVLEVGVGTGRNLAHYPSGLSLTAIDVAPRMLDRAARRTAREGRQVGLAVADVARLPFRETAFDTAVATCVFCSVADPLRGLGELRRVTRPEGRILLLEHVRPRSRLLGILADLFTPLTRRVFGFALNRRTEESLAEAGLLVEEVRREGIWREIVARPAGGTG